jgi:protein SCO1/2
VASTSGTGHQATLALDAPSQLEPPRAAPDVSLPDSLGHRVTLSQYRGKAVLLTFIYDHCPDTCPLIVSQLRNALTLLGPRAGEVRVIAVSVDPRGDTPFTVKAFLAAREMTGRMEYLIGSPGQLAPVWRVWGIAVQATPERRELGRSTLVGHSALIYGISASGNVIALYPANLKPEWIAHDVPSLAAS